MANHISLASPDSSQSASYCKSVLLIKIKLNKPKSSFGRDSSPGS